VLQPRSLDELVGMATITLQVARLLEGGGAAGLNILVSSGTQPGKTTLAVSPPTLPQWFAELHGRSELE
jgi:Flp pilus assembly CpaF family ATPase